MQRWCWHRIELERDYTVFVCTIFFLQKAILQKMPHCWGRSPVCLLIFVIQKKKLFLGVNRFISYFNVENALSMSKTIANIFKLFEDLRAFHLYRWITLVKFVEKISFFFVHLQLLTSLKAIFFCKLIVSMAWSLNIRMHYCIHSITYWQSISLIVL